MEEFNPNDWNTLAPHFDALLATELTPTEVPDWLFRWSELEKIVWEGRAHLKRAKSVDATNQMTQQAFDDFTSGAFTKFKFAVQRLREKLLALPAYQPIQQHRQLLRRWHSETELFRPENVSLQAEIDLLASRYDALVRAVNEEFPFPESSRDSLRQRNQRWLQKRDSFDQLFIQLLRQRRQLAHNAGLSDYRAYCWREMGRLDYTPNDCLLLHETIAAEVMPLARELYARTSDLADTEQPHLPKFATTSVFEEGMQPVMASVDPELGSLFTRMRAGFLDLGRRPGKASGSEEWLFPVSAIPYVRVDADGTNEGISLLLHECGHAFHDFLSLRNQGLIWNLGGPTEFEEFAAIALSYLALPHLHKVGIYSATELEQVVADQIKEAIVKWIPTIAHVDAFQHWVYVEAPENVQPDDLDAQWLALAERFRVDCDQTPLRKEDAIGWQQVGLLFRQPFYYIEYALAHLGALQLWQKMEANPALTWQSYRTALALGNTLPLPELYAAAGTRLLFEPSIVREIMQAVTDHLKVHSSTVNFATQIVGNP